MKRYIFIIVLLGMISLPKAQINSNVPVNPEIKNQNPFIDASSQSSYPSIGKGIVFPRTDLSTFRFKTNLFDGLGLVFPTAFDGMLVYNTHVEDNVTIKDPATGSYTLDLKEGFYYFSNPKGNESGNLKGGRWKPLGDANLYNGDGTLTGNREVNLDNKTLTFTGGKIGIGTTEPKTNLDVAYDDKLGITVPQAVIFPKVSTAVRDAWNTNELTEGMMIYNLTKKCLDLYNGSTWGCVNTAKSTTTYTATEKATYSQVFTKNNCASNETAGTYEVSKTESATVSSTISQADADQKAKAAALEKAKQWVQTHGQEEANNNAQCTQSTFTSTQTRSFSKYFTRNNCGYGYAGSDVTYTQSATETATSTVSQADADRSAEALALEKAKRLVDNGGQAYANQHGQCERRYEADDVCFRSGAYAGKIIGTVRSFDEYYRTAYEGKDREGRSWTCDGKDMDQFLRSESSPRHIWFCQYGSPYTPYDIGWTYNFGGEYKFCNE